MNNKNKNNMTILTTTMIATFVAILASSTSAYADTIDFESSFADQQAVNSVTTATNTVTFQVGPSSGSTGDAYIAQVGGTVTAYVPNDVIPAAGSGGNFFLTDEFDGPIDTHDYFMTFTNLISNIALDLYDYRGDGGAQIGDTATLTVFDTSNAVVGSTTYTIPSNEPDPNLAQLSVMTPSAPIASAHLSFSGSDVGTGIDNIVFTNAIITVAIDIKPGSDPNCFNNNGNGVIPVAIFGTISLDVNDIDAETVQLEGLDVNVVGKSNKLLAHIEDVNNDGFDDLVVQIEDEDGIFEVGDTTATLTGSLFDGTPIQGTDDICITQ